MGMNNDTTVIDWSDPSTTVVTDGGLETWLTFLRGVDLPAFAAYPLVAEPAGRELLREYYGEYLAIAARHDTGAILDAPTWRANPDWARTLGHDSGELARHIDLAIALMRELRDAHSGDQPVLVSAVVGPRGDGYRLETTMTSDEAAEYHRFQIARSAAAGSDVVTALTMLDIGEAAGVALAARAEGIASVISFTVETDGRLPSGATLAEAIEATDELTGSAPLHYMINCAHPVHFAGVLEPDSPWVARIGGLRANASTMSHAELDEMTELDEGDPVDLARRYVALRVSLPGLRVVGGCCGTDARHVAAITEAWAAR